MAPQRGGLIDRVPDFLCQHRMVDFIQEFEADRWEKPKDETAAFIESIEVVVQQSASSVSGAEEIKGTTH